MATTETIDNSDTDGEDEILARTLEVAVDSGDTGLIGGLL